MGTVDDQAKVYFIPQEHQKTGQKYQKRSDTHFTNKIKRSGWEDWKHG